ncbi:MAG: GTP cyclohydrolase [Bdellovibrionaceae bacterium]|nr:GTP cyclohydrolase [Pseudobdellovibrionaceae bacterium]
MNILTHFQKRIESILDAETEPQGDDVLSLKKKFEVVTDPRFIENLAEGLPSGHTDKAVILFSRLALYFDAGIFLEFDHKIWEPQAQFHYGHVRALKNQEKTKISLPRIDLMTVLRTDTSPILKKLKLQALDPVDQTVCLFIKPAPDFSFLLLSSLPELWLREHTRLVTEAIQKGLYNE